MAERGQGKRINWWVLIIAFLFVLLLTSSRSSMTYWTYWKNRPTTPPEKPAASEKERP